jgi:sugar/nucleoside kinase (ribokinase family)
MLRSLQDAGVGCTPVRRLNAYPTSKTVILVVEGQDRRYIHVFGANRGFEVGLIRRDWIDGLKVFYFGGLFATPGIRAEALAELLQYCRQHGIVTIVDVVIPDAKPGMRELGQLLPHIDYFLPNNDEAERLTGCSEVEEQAQRFLACGAGTVIVSCGADGCLAACGQLRWRANACRVSGIDPSGSGDAFAAGVITGVLRRWDIEETLRYAAALGASATLAVGATAGVFDGPQARAFLDRHEVSITAWQREA